jgi:hypothetical protein
MYDQGQQKATTKAAHDVQPGAAENHNKSNRIKKYKSENQLPEAVDLSSSGLAMPQNYSSGKPSARVIQYLNISMRMYKL